MSFRLVYGDFDFHVTLPFEASVEERLYRIVSQSGPQDVAVLTRQDLARRIVDVVTAILEGEILPPTGKQLRYALAIAQELSLDLPSEALHYRQSMAVFLSTHAESYRRSKEMRRLHGLQE